MAAKFRIEYSLLLVHGVVPMRAAPFRRLEGPSETLLHRLDMDRELPSPSERTLVCHAEKVEGVRLCPKALIERLHVDPGQLPIVLCPGGHLLRNPGETELARCIGLLGPIDPNRIYDIAIIGAVRQASRPLSMRDPEGLRTLVLDCRGSAVKLVPRLGSRTIWDFRPASPAWL